jgi:hypothetical protein
LKRFLRCYESAAESQSEDRTGGAEWTRRTGPGVLDPAAIELRDLLSDEQRTEVFKHLRQLLHWKDPLANRTLDVKSVEGATELLVMCESGVLFGSQRVRILFTLVPERQTFLVLWVGVRPIGKGLPGRAVLASQIRLKVYTDRH